MGCLLFRLVIDQEHPLYLIEVLSSRWLVGLSLFWDLAGTLIELFRVNYNHCHATHLGHWFGYLLLANLAHQCSNPGAGVFGKRPLCDQSFGVWNGGSPVWNISALKELPELLYWSEELEIPNEVLFLTGHALIVIFFWVQVFIHALSLDHLLNNSV